MSTNKTQNYQLHGWAVEDEFPRGELNANFTKLDTALKAEENARAGAVNTLNAALAGKAAIVTGTYTGNKADTRTINLGFTPQMVFVITKDALLIQGTYTYGGLALKNNPASAVTIVDGGFTIRCYNAGNHVICSNEQNYQYFYWALR